MSVYKEFIISLQDYSDQIETIVHYVTELDMIITKAYLAKKYNYCMPEIDDNATYSFFKAKDMRHVLIEHLQQDESYVPNDIELGYDTSQRGILLYGTNAVGKSSQGADHHRRDATSNQGCTGDQIKEKMPS